MTFSQTDDGLSFFSRSLMWFLSCIWVYVCFVCWLQVSVVCERGLSVGSSWMSMLGNPSKGEMTFTTHLDFITLILEFQ